MLHAPLGILVDRALVVDHLVGIGDSWCEQQEAQAEEIWIAPERLAILALDETALEAAFAATEASIDEIRTLGRVLASGK